MTLTYSILSILALFILLFFSALSSASEGSVLAASRVRLFHLSKKGNKKASIIMELQAHIGRFISSILLLNTMFNAGVTALAAGVMTFLFGAAGAIYAAFIMGALITIYCEVLPKMFVYTNPERVALAFAPFFKPLVYVMSPVTRGIDYIAKHTLRAFGFNPTHDVADTSLEELRGAIELHGETRGEGEYERAMLRSILDLTAVEVTEIMRHRKTMLIIDIDLPNQEIVDQVLQAPYTRIPLWKGNPDNIIGVLHAKALLRAVQLHQGDINKLDIGKIANTPWFIPETTTLFSQLAAFRQRHEHFALVLDEYGVLQGMVTLEDILEEIVGEIVDEHDVEIPGVRIGTDGTYVVDGNVTLRDLNREFRWDLPDAHAATLAGLILHEAREIPEVGQSFLIRNFRMDILRRHKHQITQVRLTPPSTSMSGEGHEHLH